AGRLCAYSPFNPRPTRRLGATVWAPRLAWKRLCFQSSPNPEAGRYIGGGLRQGRLGLSILAQPGGWALPPSRCFPTRPRATFNPRPTRRLGATWLAALSWQ